MSGRVPLVLSWPTGDSCRSTICITNKWERTLPHDSWAGDRRLVSLTGREGGSYNPLARGYSSIGRARRSHRRGRGFESPYLHQKPRALRSVKRERLSPLPSLCSDSAIRCSLSLCAPSYTPKVISSIGRGPRRSLAVGDSPLARAPKMRASSCGCSCSVILSANRGLTAP